VELRRAWLLAFGVLAVVSSACAQRAMATMSFSAPTPLAIADGTRLDLESHAAARCFDWDADGDIDLLVGGGDGRLWRLVNLAEPASEGGARFGAPVLIRAGARERWGRSYTGVALAELTGDGLPELLVAHSGDRLSIHVNVGTPSEPVFAEESQTVSVQRGCQGRFDVGDWDGDGLCDLVTGAFGGQVTWHRNVGTAQQARFAEAEPFHDITVAYNSHPRLFDFDRDGRLDLLLGVNWGTVTLYRNVGQPGAPALAGGQSLRAAATGRGLNIREHNGDDTTPEFADLDGDGVLDLVSGGKNGRVFVLRGIGASDRVATLTRLLAAAGDDGPGYFERDAAARREVMAALGALQADLATGLVAGDAREGLFVTLAPLAARHRAVLGRHRFDLEVAPHAPMLAAQFWVVLLESLPGTPANRARIADALDFQGGYRRLLVDLGVVLFDNDRASPRQLERMHALLSTFPREIWDVELISVAGWLGEGLKDHPVRSRTGVNIFAMKLGVPENSFAADAPRAGVTDVFLICLAHEVAHNMLDTVGRRARPELFERKFEGLANAAGDAVVYRSPKSRGIDSAATKARFRALGAWDGDDATWRDAWRSYFAGKERFDRSYARGNVQFFLDAPQEAFATLANQYVTDSELMLEFSKVRWDAGHRNTVNQFLLFADYLSGGRDTVTTYVLARGGEMTTATARLARDPEGRIVRFVSAATEATFGYDDGSLVARFERRSGAEK